MHVKFVSKFWPSFCYALNSTMRLAGKVADIVEHVNRLQSLDGVDNTVYKIMGK